MIRSVCLPVGIMPTNCYLVWADGSSVAAVIDPGNDADIIRNNLAERGLTAGAVLLTHGHFDHIGAAEALCGTGIPLYLHAEDACMLTDPERNGSLFFGIPPVRCGAAAVPVADGDSLAVGSLELTVLHTPGHSRGSVCYLCEDRLFTGDTMFADGYGRTDLWGGSFETLRRSLRRILPYRHSHVILPGHGYSYSE